MHRESEAEVLRSSDLGPKSDPTSCRACRLGKGFRQRVTVPTLSRLFKKVPSKLIFSHFESSRERSAASCHRAPL